MTINLLLTKVFYIGTLIFSLFSILSSSQIVSVILLISSFVCAALFLINLGIKFVGLSYIVIYVGAIAVLFLFVIMMIDVNKSDEFNSNSFYAEAEDTESNKKLPFSNTSAKQGDKEYKQNLPLAVFLSIFLVLLISWLINISPTNYQLGLSNFISSGNLEKNILDLLNIVLEINPLSLNSNNASGNLSNIQQIINAASQTTIGSSTGAQVIHYSSYLTGENISVNHAALIDSNLKNFEQISSLGFNLYNNYPLIYLLSGFILLFSMFSAVILSKKEREN